MKHAYHKGMMGESEIKKMIGRKKKNKKRKK